MVPRKAILATAALLSAAGLILSRPQPVVRLLRTLFPNLIWELPTSERVIAITFDDGPDPNFTPEVLEILREHKTPATFFLVGERVRRYPDLFRKILDEGHAVGNHSDSWHRTIQLTNDRFEHDLLRAEQSLDLRGPSKLFRPAGGMIRPAQLRLLTAHHYRAVLGSAFAFDPYRPPAKFIAWAITRALRHGAIIVLHDSGGDRSNSVAALPQIIGHANAAGYRFVKLSDYL